MSMNIIAGAITGMRNTAMENIGSTIPTMRRVITIGTTTATDPGIGGNADIARSVTPHV